MSDVYQSLTHSKWDCKYHVVFVPKRRRKAIFGQTRRQLGAIFHALEAVEFHLLPQNEQQFLAPVSLRTLGDIVRRGFYLGPNQSS